MGYVNSIGNHRRDSRLFGDAEPVIKISTGSDSWPGLYRLINTQLARRSVRGLPVTVIACSKSAPPSAKKSSPVANQRFISDKVYYMEQTNNSINKANYDPKKVEL